MPYGDNNVPLELLRAGSHMWGTSFQACLLLKGECLAEWSSESQLFMDAEEMLGERHKTLRIEHCLKIKRGMLWWDFQLRVFLSPLWQNSLSLSTLVNIHNEPEPRDWCLSPSGLHLVFTQMYLSSEKGSNQLTSGRRVSPCASASLLLIQVLPGSSRELSLEWRTCSCPS